MAKKRITIPKGVKDCDGIECEKSHTFEIDIPESHPTVETVPEASVENIGGTTTQLLKEIPIPTEKKILT